MTISGGYLEDIPKPHHRKWPTSTERRRVDIKIYTWRGTSLGAEHWYVEIKEEDNPIWDRRTHAQSMGYEPTSDYLRKICGWTRPWDDKNGRGRRVTAPDLYTLVDAIAWTEKTLERRFRAKDKYVFMFQLEDYDTIPELTRAVREHYGDRYLKSDAYYRNKINQETSNQ